MRLLRNIYACFGHVNRYLSSRSFMSQLYHPRDNTEDLYVIRVPVDEGVSEIGDFDIILNDETKEIVLVAKRKKRLHIDVARLSPISSSSSLEDCAPSDQFLEPELR